MKKRILIADDESNVRELFTELFEDDYKVIQAEDGKHALDILKSESVDLLILDLKMPRMGGMEVLEELQRRNAEVLTIVVTADKDIKTAVRAMKLGAYDYIIKPFDIEKARILMTNALEKITLKEEIRGLRQAMEHKYGFDDIIGTSKAMQSVYQIIQKVINNDSTILITGNSGTGKELIAHAIHYNSHRRDYPFIAVDCASIPETLIENELFGHEKGAFTGAMSRKIGKFELSNKGTLFLDEIGNLRMDVQAKLLRVLQEFEIERVGGSTTIKIDVRIIAATNANLEKMIREGAFREDLYYRLNVVPIQLPALRERREDIPLLLKYFMDIYQKEFNKKTVLSQEAIDYLTTYEWVGNVREMKNMIQRIVLMSEKTIIQPEDLPQQVREKEIVNTERISAGMTLEEMEKILIRETILKNNHNLSKSARVLGITRKTLHNKLKKHPDLLNVR